MRVAKPLNLILPSKVVTGVSEVDKNRDNCLYFVHHLATLPLFDKRIDDEFNGFTPVNKEKLSKITGCNIDSCIKLLLNGEIIQRDFYKLGTKPYYYRVNPELINGSYTSYQLTANSKLYQNIINKHRLKRTHHNRLEPFLKQMQKFVMKIPYDYQSAYKWITSNATGAKKLSYLIAVSQIEDKRFRYFKRNSTNQRLDTNFTNLKSELRQFIIGDYIQIDLKNSQPFFLSVFIEKLTKNITNINTNINSDNTKQLGTIPICLGFTINDVIKVFGLQTLKSISKIRQNRLFSNLAKFRNSTLQGTFYDDFVEIYGNGITRKEVKDIMFKVLFSRNQIYENHKRFTPYENEKKIFAEVYPDVYEVIRILKTKDHANLAITLQKIESYLFIDVVAKKLVEAGIIPLTIHDSVIVPKDRKNETLKIMKDAFLENLGCTPKFEIENL